ncbi:hypothetical protein CAPTEDRAFT_189848 [Capitella teleta]|uniref:G-protein coupled receptors family 1 profile domain-containing protein n=1 Tax=Capitella teleta TaxID=283909 RepID=R7T8H4_CAPTE|nr:hypothetical protein CAPTEDRAFT_189848 [Capitella teleta]|eukprot:ELT87294.1 hypothetical protein CAPTEDRAFT_189848 [Capitella teleta]
MENTTAFGLFSQGGITDGMEDRHVPFSNWCHLYMKILGGAVGGTIAVVGLLGNILTLYIIHKHAQNASTMFLVSSLVVVELIQIAFFGSLTLSLTLTQDAALKSRIQAYAYAEFTALTTTLLSITVWLTVAIMWHRYATVRNQGKKANDRIVKVYVLIIVLLSCVYNIPHIFERRLVSGDQPGFLRHVPTSLGASSNFKLYYNTISFYALHYVIPLPLLIYPVCKLRRSISKRLNVAMNVGSRRAVNEKEITRSLIAIVSIFGVCHVLSQVRRILLHVYSDPREALCGEFVV